VLKENTSPPIYNSYQYPFMSEKDQPRSPRPHTMNILYFPQALQEAISHRVSQIQEDQHEFSKPLTPSPIDWILAQSYVAAATKLVTPKPALLPKPTPPKTPLPQPRLVIQFAPNTPYTHKQPVALLRDLNGGLEMLRLSEVYQSTKGNLLHLMFQLSSLPQYQLH
jgi:hypothetical protein